MNPAAEPPLGLYVHVPFCEVKCTYCHFAIDPRRPDAARQSRYVGIDLAAFRRRHGADLLREYGPALRDSFAAGLLETSDGRLRLTGRGLLVSNEVFQVFI